MARRAYKRIAAVCPFYRWERSQVIACESPAGEESGLHLTFATHKAKDRWVRTYCLSECQKTQSGRTCRIARMLDQEYGEKKDPE